MNPLSGRGVVAELDADAELPLALVLESELVLETTLDAELARELELGTLSPELDAVLALVVDAELAIAASEWVVAS